MTTEFDDYDPGYLNDYGGGNTSWWMDYIRAEIGRCNEFWRNHTESIVAEIDRLNKLTQWIPVSDRFPKINEVVLTIYHPGGYVQKRCYVGSEMWYDFEDMRNISQRNITHWMPLPNPPEVS